MCPCNIQIDRDDGDISEQRLNEHFTTMPVFGIDRAMNTM